MICEVESTGTLTAMEFDLKQISFTRTKVKCETKQLGSAESWDKTHGGSNYQTSPKHKHKFPDNL